MGLIRLLKSMRDLLQTERMVILVHRSGEHLWKGL